MRFKQVHKCGYTEVYKVLRPDSKLEMVGEVVLVEFLYKYILHDGYALWRVAATYAKQLDPKCYYVIAQDKATAMDKFLKIAPCLNVIKSISKLGDSDAADILANPAKFIVW